MTQPKLSIDIRMTSNIKYLVLLYQNHIFEFFLMDKKLLYEILLKSIDFNKAAGAIFELEIVFRFTITFCPCSHKETRSTLHIFQSSTIIFVKINSKLIQISGEHHLIKRIKFYVYLLPRNYDHKKDILKHWKSHLYHGLKSDEILILI